MKIHSSSLASIPKKFEAKKNSANNASLPSEVSLKEPVSAKPQSMVNAKGIVTVSDIDTIINGIKKTQTGSFNTQPNRAINAYIQENIQPLKNQRSELASKVDFYI